MDDLEILDRRLRDSAVEVEHVGLRVVVPHRGLVVQLDHALRALVLPAGQQGLVVLRKPGPSSFKGGTQPLPHPVWPHLTPADPRLLK